MPIVTEKFAFYHCPRTGGTWVRSVLDHLHIEYEILGYQHDTPADVPPDRFSFSIWRDPELWLKSWRALVETNPQWSWPIPDWLLNAKTLGDTQLVFENYIVRVDTLLRLELLRNDLQWVFDHVGLDLTVPDLPKVNEGNYAT